MKLEHLLLGVLLMRPRTGYDLKRFMDMHGVFMRARTQMSQVYRSLNQMAERGWVIYVVSGRPGAQDAKIYRTTEQGEAEFMKWLLSPFIPVIGIPNYELRARLWFSGFMSEEQIIDLLDTEIRARQQQVAIYRFRDRTIEIADGSWFDLELATFVEEFEHQAGAATMDQHIESMLELRASVAKRILLREHESNDTATANGQA